MFLSLHQINKVNSTKVLTATRFNQKIRHRKKEQRRGRPLGSSSSSNNTATWLLRAKLSEAYIDFTITVVALSYITFKLNTLK